MTFRTCGHRLCLLAAALWLSGGCANDYGGDAAAYRDVLDASPQPPQQTDADSATAAQDQGPLHLRDALLLANLHNEQLAAEGENYVQALIDTRRAAAEFLPTIGVSPGYARRDRYYERGDPGDAPEPDTFEADLGLEWNIFNGYRDVANLHRAAATVEQRRAILLDFRSTILLDVADAFYAALTAERAQKVLVASLAVQDERVRDMRARREAGVARPLDVSQTEAQASAARVSLITARNLAANSRAALKLLTRSPVEGRELVDDEVPAQEDEPLEAWLARAAVGRQDLVAAAAAVEATRFRVDRAIGQYYPTVTLNLDTVLTVDNAATEARWAGVLRANLPLFTAGRIAADVRTAWSELRQAKLIHEYTRRVVVRDVEVAYENWSSSMRRLQELRIQLRAGQDAFSQADQSYNVGLATNLERLVAQDRLLNTELQLVTEEIVQRRSHVALIRATGELTPWALARSVNGPAAAD